MSNGTDKPHLPTATPMTTRPALVPGTVEELAGRRSERTAYDYQTPTAIGSSFFDVTRSGTPMRVHIWNPVTHTDRTETLRVIPARVKLIDLHGRPMPGLYTWVEDTLETSVGILDPRVPPEKAAHGSISIWQAGGWRSDSRQIYGTRSDTNGEAFVYIPVEWFGTSSTLKIMAADDIEEEPGVWGKLEDLSAAQAVLDPFVIQVSER